MSAVLASVRPSTTTPSVRVELSVQDGCGDVHSDHPLRAELSADGEPHWKPERSAPHFLSLREECMT